MIFGPLRLFVKTLTAGDNYSLCNIWNLQDLSQMHLSKKVKTFCGIFSPFLNLHQILDILKKNITLIAYVFPKLQTVKDMFRQNV